MYFIHEVGVVPIAETGVHIAEQGVIIAGMGESSHEAHADARLKLMERGLGVTSELYPDDPDGWTVQDELFEYGDDPAPALTYLVLVKGELQ